MKTTKDKIIHEILKQMNYAENYDFLVLWHGVTNVKKEGSHNSEMRLCFDEMYESKLLKAKGGDRTEIDGRNSGSILVTIHPNGDQIMKAGGWIKYQRNKKWVRKFRILVFIGTFIFSGLGLIIPKYCSDQEHKQAELMQQLFLIRAEEIIQRKNVEALIKGQQVVQENIEQIRKNDSSKLARARKK